MIMTEVEPIIENVQPGDVVTIERGGSGEPGHTSFTYLIVSSPDGRLKSSEVTVKYAQRITKPDAGWRITRITRPAPPIPTTPGTRFWARRSAENEPREFLVVNGGSIVAIDVGIPWDRSDFNWTIVPAPEPETVPVPADLIREAEEWRSAPIHGTAVRIIRDIVQAVREREGES